MRRTSQWVEIKIIIIIKIIMIEKVPAPSLLLLAYLRELANSKKKLFGCV